MRNAALAAVVFLSACGGGNPTRYFRVLFPASSAQLPDSCYQAATLPTASTVDEVAAESYCRVGKKSSSTGSTSNLVTSQAWTMVDTGSGKLYLVLANSGGAGSTGVEGAFTNGKYTFDAQTSSFEKQCTGTNVRECNGACVNRLADPNNCGSCGFVCAAGMACRLGGCTTMCPAITQTCGGVTVNLQTDDANCGVCGRACTGGLVCSGGICVEPCQASCSDKYSAAGCGVPRQFSRTSDTKIEFELKGQSLTGTVNGTISYACSAMGCAADFAMRCPSCSTSNLVYGTELNNVTEFEAR